MVTIQPGGSEPALLSVLVPKGERSEPINPGSRLHHPPLSHVEGETLMKSVFAKRFTSVNPPTG